MITTAPDAEKGERIYEITLGEGDCSESDDLNQVLQVLQEHLDAAERSGRKIRIVIYRI